ncbi:MAG: PIN domain-containing protein [Gemmatimonadales bacterium]|nr:PIN domain-containing protein [Gemmatimonadales bacterium]
MLAYLDTSVVVAIRFNQAGAERFRDILTDFEVYASPLLEAEWRSALRREQVAPNLAELELVQWVFQERTLSEELERVFEAGYVRGADAWHLATALSLAPNPAELTFLTLDDRQRGVAEALGFRT